jgi:HK97 family phage major capsid protein
MEEKDFKALVDKVGQESAEAIKSLFAKEVEGGVIADLKKKIEDVSKVDEKDIKEYIKSLQEQVNSVETKIKERKTDNPEKLKVEYRAKTNAWVKAMLKKESKKMKELEAELKAEYYWPAHVLHTGGNDNIDEGVDTQGGYLIPELLLAEVQRFVYEYGIARRDMRYLPFSGPGNERRIPTLATSVVVSWIDEGETKPKTKPVFDEVKQTLKKLAGIVIMTEEIIEDSAIDLIALCGQLFGEAIAEEEDRVFLAGDIGAGDPYDGVLNAAGVVPVPLPAGDMAAQITPDNVLQALYSIPTPARKGAKIYMNPSIFAVIRAYRADAVVAADRAGNYLVQSPTEMGKWMLWGHEVVESDVLPEVSDVTLPDTPFAFVANLQKTCVYGDKLGMRVKLLDQASVYDTDGTLLNLAERDLLALRVHKRVGYVPVLPAGIAVIQSGPVS